MKGFDEAVKEVVLASRTEANSRRIERQVDLCVVLIESSPVEMREAAMRSIAAAMVHAAPGCAPTLALLGGALIEVDPTLVDLDATESLIDTLNTRAPELLGGASRPRRGFFCRALVALLSRHAERRGMIQREGAIEALLLPLVSDPDALFLFKLLGLIDGTIRCLLPDDNCEVTVRVRGVADNKQLHILLCDALLADDGLALSGERPHPAAVGIADGSRRFQPGLLYEPRWQMFQARACDSEGGLPTEFDPMSADLWIAPADLPMNIEIVDGIRTLALGEVRPGPKGAEQAWEIYRAFEALAASVVVVDHGLGR